MSNRREMEERQRRRRELAERRRAARKRQLMFRMIIAGAVIAAVVLVLLLIFGRRSNKDGSAGGSTNAGNTGAGVNTIDLTASGGETAAQSGGSAAPAASQTATVEIDIRHIPETASSREEALAAGKLFAMQYDYDKALAVLRSVPGYESDSEITGEISRISAEKSSCTAVDVTTVPHVFFHSLLNDDRGLKTEVVGSDRAWRNDAAMTTAHEFDQMIQMMYDAGYVLIGLDDMCIKTRNEDGSISIEKNTNLMLPPGKKAFVLSEDDLSYYHTYGIGTQGYATKMVLDEEGRVRCEYTDENGETHIGDYDVSPRLDSFIREHPDFSYHNARGTIALTGYNGVFGYRTNDYYKDINNPKLDRDQIEWLEQHPDFDWDTDVAEATKIANALKEEGWTFASHTYAHWNASSKSVESLISDNERWMTVNHPIVGDIDKIIFAFGGDIGVVGGYTADNEKYQYFKSQGYCIFCNVDGNIGWTEFGPNYMRTGRVPLDGFTMYQTMTPDAPSHGTYAKAYEQLGIHDVESFFNPYRITPIDSE